MRYVVAILLAILATVGMGLFYDAVFDSNDLATAFNIITGFIFGWIAFAIADDY